MQHNSSCTNWHKRSGKPWIHLFPQSTNGLGNAASGSLFPPRAMGRGHNLPLGLFQRQRNKTPSLSQRLPGMVGTPEKKVIQHRMIHHRNIAHGPSPPFLMSTSLAFGNFLRCPETKTGRHLTHLLCRQEDICTFHLY